MNHGFLLEGKPNNIKSHVKVIVTRFYFFPPPISDLVMKLLVFANELQSLVSQTAIGPCLLYLHKKSSFPVHNVPLQSFGH